MKKLMLGLLLTFPAMAQVSNLVPSPAASLGGMVTPAAIAINSGFVAALLLIQHMALRHRPDLYKKLAWINFGTAGVLGGVAKYNMGVR